MPTQVKSEKLVALHNQISSHMEEIENLFNRPVKITVIVRTSNEVEGNVVLTSDTLRDVIGQLAIMEGWPDTFKAGEKI